MKPINRIAQRLLHDGAVALSIVEANGIRIDEEYLHQTIEDVRKRIRTGREKLKSSKVYSTWRSRYGSGTNFGSPDQFRKVMYEDLGYDCSIRTATGKWSTSEEALSTIDSPFVRNYLKLKKLEKLEGTYLSGIVNEVCDGYLHPFFNLHTVKTYRSSSSNPNFQNIPIRNPIIGNMIRKCFIPRENHVLVEIDFKGLEVSIACAYHKDPLMMEYENDPAKDMHRDSASEVFMCGPEDVSKTMRYCGKNMFVFPQFYGDFYKRNAVSLWGAMESMNLTIGEIPVREWLRDLGIRELGNVEDRDPPKGTYLAHLKAVENDFWNNRFKVYGEWKKTWYRKYLRNGGFSMLTGFREEGVYGRNDVINHPVQGSAFHCLLWSLIRLNRWLLDTGKKSKIIGQIHDSIVADVHIDEYDEYLAKAKQITTVDLRKEWKWINVPLSVDAEACGLGESWADKKEVEL